ncbi:hypothetical protein V6Z11_D05G299000 [Gossypium hirsutum]
MNGKSQTNWNMMFAYLTVGASTHHSCINT